MISVETPTFSKQATHSLGTPSLDFCATTYPSDILHANLAGAQHNSNLSQQSFELLIHPPGQIRETVHSFVQRPLVVHEVLASAWSKQAHFAPKTARNFFHFLYRRPALIPQP